MSNDNNIDAPYADKLYRAAKSVLSHWDEFGPEAGFDECTEVLRKAMSEYEQRGADIA